MFLAPSGFADNLAADFRWSLHNGFDGWIDDDLAFTKSWGFSLESIGTPVILEKLAATAR